MIDARELGELLAQRVGPSVVEDVRLFRQQLDEQAGHDIHRLAEVARRVADEFRLRQATTQTGPSQN